MLAKRLQDLADELKTTITDEKYLALCNISQTMFHVVNRDMDKAEIYFRTATDLLSQRVIDQAIENYENDADITTACFGPQHHTLGPIYYNIGLALKLRGQYAEAQHFLEKSIEIKQLNGNENLPLAKSHITLASILSLQGRDNEALTYFQKALNIRLAVLGPDHSKVANSHRHMGATLNNLNRYEEAAQHYERCLNIRLAELGSEVSAVAQVRHDLAVVYKELNLLDKARAELELALGVYERLYGPNDGQTIAVQDCLNSLK